jgi:N-formylglutamate amidohydrolase
MERPFLCRRGDSVKLVLHVPHSSTHIPACERQSLLLSDDELHQELLHMTDAYTDELFGIPQAATVRYPVSRLVADPERFEDDTEESMTKVGMGVIYTKTCCGQPLRQPPSPEERKAKLAQYYHPHHQTLTRAVNEALTSSGSCLVIDCHSFPQVPLPYELNRNLVRPDICIGTDSFHTPRALEDVLVSQFTGVGYTVAVNHPFSGALVPSQFYRKDKNVQSVMIEIRRSLYMDESTGEKSGGFDDVRGTLSTVLSTLAVRA